MKLTCELCGGSGRDVLLSKKGHDYVACESCGFVTADISAADFARHNEDLFGETWEAYVAKSFTQRKARRYRRRLKRFAPWARRANDEAQRQGPGRLLELGSNVGAFLNEARAAGWDAIGVEPVERCVRHARSLGLEVFAGVVDDAPFEPESFDVLYSHAVFEHLPAPLATLRAALRLLRPGGLVYLDTVNWASYTRRFLAERWKLVDPTMHACLYTPSTLRLLCERAGLDVLSISSHGVRFRPNDAPRLVGTRRWLEEAAKLPLSIASRITLRGETIAVMAERPLGVQLSEEDTVPEGLRYDATT